MKLGLGMVMVVLAGAGCDAIFRLEHVEAHPDAGQDAFVYDRCSPIPEDGLHYAAIRNPNLDEKGHPQPWSWQEAQAACMRRGMDLAVINDQHELASADIEAATYWVGATFDAGVWSSVDGCAPFTASANPAVAGKQCGLAGNGMVSGVDCSGVLPEDQLVLAALCEAPRPAVECPAPDLAAEGYVLSDAPMAYSEGREFCATLGGHLTVINSLAELHLVSTLANDAKYPAFWVGATFDNRTWQSDDSECPGLYSWSQNTPVFDVSTSCVAMTIASDPDQPGVTWVDGMTPTRCNATTIRALCELGD